MADVTLAERFHAERARLWSIAYRVLGSTADAEDAVQEAWLRLERTDAASIENLGGWLTTVVTRVCLNQLRTRATHREDLGDPPEVAGEFYVEDEVLLADAVGAAFAVVLHELTPAERVAFVLHDAFGVPFDELADILGRTPAAVRQLASRARRRVRDAPAGPAVDREVVDAFLRASREGDLDGLIGLLDPGARVSADPAAVATGTPRSLAGANDVAAMFCGRATGARRIRVDGRPGAAWVVRGEVRVVFDFTVAEGRVTRVHLLADRAQLDELELVLEPT